MGLNVFEVLLGCWVFSFVILQKISWWCDFEMNECGVCFNRCSEELVQRRDVVPENKTLLRVLSYLNIIFSTPISAMHVRILFWVR